LIEQVLGGEAADGTVIGPDGRDQVARGNIHEIHGRDTGVADPLGKLVGIDQDQRAIAVRARDGGGQALSVLAIDGEVAVLPTTRIFTDSAQNGG
jgi:hypothetical protein